MSACGRAVADHILRVNAPAPSHSDGHFTRDSLSCFSLLRQGSATLPSLAPPVPSLSDTVTGAQSVSGTTFCCRPCVTHLTPLYFHFAVIDETTLPSVVNTCLRINCAVFSSDFFRRCSGIMQQQGGGVVAEEGKCVDMFKACVKELITFLGQKIVWIDIPELHHSLCEKYVVSALVGCVIVSQVPAECRPGRSRRSVAERTDERGHVVHHGQPLPSSAQCSSVVLTSGLRATATLRMQRSEVTCFAGRARRAQSRSVGRRPRPRLLLRLSSCHHGRHCPRQKLLRRGVLVQDAASALF